MMTWKKTLATCIYFIAAIAGLVLTIGLAISYGAKEMTLATVWEAVFRYDPAATSHQIIHGLRLPRVIGAVVTGMALAVAGAVMQGVTRNPLADSGILGVNAGSAFVVALSFAILPGLSYSNLILLSFAGAALTTLLIVLLGSSAPGGLSALKLTIAGAVLAAILHALSSGVAIYFGLSQDLAYWYAGGVAGVTLEQLQVLLKRIAIGSRS